MPAVPVVAQVALLAFALSLLGVRMAMWLARRLRYLDVAGSEAHKQQKETVPYGGGPAIALAVALALGYGYLRGAGTHLAPEADGHQLWPAFAGAVLLLAVGLRDDWKALRARTKLLAQAAVAAFAVWFGDLGIDSLHQWPLLAYGCAWAWLVLVSNAFNLLDHADGLSASVAAVSCAVLIGGAFMTGDIELAMVLLALTGGLGGFLVWNAPPARIYMGDAGSLPLGFLVGYGTLTVTFWNSDSGGLGWLALLTPLIITAIPLFDTAVVVVKRLRRRQPIMKGDRNHIGHRLVRLGLSPLGALTVVVCLQVALAGSAIVLRSGDAASAWVALLQDAAILGAVVLLETARDHG